MLAKVMILIVNTWLGYPYFMMLCMGLQKSIPRDLYEASALAGAGPLTNFFKITWPLIRKPLTPLLIASFAFNFNNFVLIPLLTKGRPDFLDTTVPAGETDILVTLHLPHRVRVGPELRPGGRDLDDDLRDGRDPLGRQPAADQGHRRGQALTRHRTSRSRQESVMAIVTGQDRIGGGSSPRTASSSPSSCSPCSRSSMVISISLRPGNFATGSLIPEQHQPRALEAGARHVLRRRRRHGRAAAVPGAALAVELDQDRDDRGAPDRRALDDRGLRLRAPAVPLQER